MRPKPILFAQLRSSHADAILFAECDSQTTTIRAMLGRHRIALLDRLKSDCHPCKFPPVAQPLPPPRSAGEYGYGSQRPHRYPRMPHAALRHPQNDLEPRISAVSCRIKYDKTNPILAAYPPVPSPAVGKPEVQVPRSRADASSSRRPTRISYPLHDTNHLAGNGGRRRLGSAPFGTREKLPTPTHQKLTNNPAFASKVRRLTATRHRRVG